MESTSRSAVDQPPQLPGLHLPIDHELDQEERFVHGVNEWAQDPRLTAKEISMLKLMNSITDKPNWNKKVANTEILARWREEALALPLISEAAWEWCLAELQDKAKYFERNDFVLTLDTGSRCAKSDTLIDADLRRELCNAVEPLLEREEKDWHPGSDEQVLDLVHPSLFPLVYGRTLVTETTDFGLDKFMDAFAVESKTLPAGQEVRSIQKKSGFRSWGADPRPWSNAFQWLPSEVKFIGQSGTDVRIASYINNLHPEHHRALYAPIEKMIAKSIPLWNEVLIRDEWVGQGGHSVRLGERTPPRIQTYGHESDPPGLPEWANDLIQIPGGPDEEAIAKVKAYLEQPDNPDYESGYGDEEMAAKVEAGTWVEDGEAYKVLHWKFFRIRRIIHPEPGAAYSYEDWKAGYTDASVVSPWRYGRRYTLHGEERTSAQEERRRSHTYYDVNIEDQFRNQGLQIIVKLASIELTPEKPDYPGGSWHLEGMLNEHIVATSIYYYDVSNTTDSRIRFRQEASLDEMHLQYEQGDHGPLAEIFGTESMHEEPAVQELGAIATPQGRLLCFPNTLQHRVDPFSLADKSQPGHRRFLVLWLVDPHYKIISTANVPPQQHHWWEPRMLKPVLEKSDLPPELQALIREEAGEWPMGLDEAKRLRLELMAERTTLVESVEDNFENYNLCEH